MMAHAIIARRIRNPVRIYYDLPICCADKIPKVAPLTVHNLGLDEKSVSHEALSTHP